MADTSQPLISCVMPTTARRRLFVPQAIRLFQRQDYANKELLIVDDGPESMEEIVPVDDPQVRYIPLAGGRTLGMKRNFCVEAARGNLIMHWDDDDWASPCRISYQTDALLRANAEICGVRQMIFYELTTARAWLYEYPVDQRPWLAGNSLLYTREFWQRSPFPDIQVASDTRFVWNQTMDRHVAVPDYSFYVAMIHPDNTSPKNYKGSYWSPWPGSVERIMGADYAFYQTFLEGAEKKETSHSDVTGPTIEPQREQLSFAPSTDEEEKQADAKEKQEQQRASHHSTPELTHNYVSPLIHTNGRKPVVSCILATGNRPAFTRQAIRCFLRQTFDDSELIVVDDGEQSTAELCAGLFRVRHIRLDEPTTLGRKLNIGIEQAAGSIIQKLDDDDFYHQDFLAHSVGALRDADKEEALVTWDCFTILIAGESCVRHSGHGWTTGATLCFHRKLWEQHGFRDEPSRVDTSFIEDHAPQLVKVCAPQLIMVVRHGNNTWTQLSNGFPVDDYFKSLPTHERSLDDLVEPIDRLFYHSLGKEGAP
ncbi:MAG: glycosyltransferase [Pyrinomonadaceae bacterium]